MNQGSRLHTYTSILNCLGGGTMIAELQTAPIPLGPKILRSIPRAVVGDHANQGEEVVGTARVLLHLLVHPLCDVRGQDLHQGGRRQSPHRVVLDRPAGQVGVRDEGKVVDGPDQDAQVLFVVVGKHQLLEMLKLGGIDRPVPLELVLALLDHRPQLLVLVHPGGEGLLVAARSVLQGVGGEADEVEVALHEVQDERFPGNLLVLGGHVVLPLGLNDALPQVLNARALWEGSANIDHPINLLFAFNCGRHFLKQLFDDVKLSLDKRVVIVLTLGEGAFELLVDEVIHGRLGDKINVLHLPQLGGDLQLLDQAGDDHAASGPAPPSRQGYIVLHCTMQPRLLLLLTLVVILAQSRRVKLGGKTCEYEGSTICNGAVVSETPFSAMICDGGKIKKKGIRGVKGNPRLGKNTGPGKDCLWYDTVF